MHQLFSCSKMNIVFTWPEYSGGNVWIQMASFRQIRRNVVSPFLPALMVTINTIRGFFVIHSRCRLICSVKLLSLIWPCFPRQGYYGFRVVHQICMCCTNEWLTDAVIVQCLQNVFTPLTFSTFCCYLLEFKIDSIQILCH